MNLTSAPLRIGALAILAAIVIGCGGSEATPTPQPTPEPTPEPVALSVEASEFKYDPSEITIPAGGDTTIELVNVGIVEHDFTIDELDFQIKAGIGETVQGTLSDAPAGTYKIYCTVPGHEAAGMVGSLVVTA